jgi:uncharacterized membrane protein
MYAIFVAVCFDIITAIILITNLIESWNLNWSGGIKKNVINGFLTIEGIVECALGIVWLMKELGQEEATFPMFALTMIILGFDKFCDNA